MTTRSKISEGITKVALCCAILGLTVQPSVSQETVQPSVSQELEERIPIPISVRKDIRVVFQIKDDDWKKGIGKGLYYVGKLVETYDSMGIDPKDRSIHAVFHDSAGYWMLKDSAYNKTKGINTGNPNKEAIRKLTQQGVSIELCAQTMKSHGWVADDILPDVKVVVGAYPRIIDLQMQGYAYIRF